MVNDGDDEPWLETWNDVLKLFPCSMENLAKGDVEAIPIFPSYTTLRGGVACVEDDVIWNKPGV